MPSPPIQTPAQGHGLAFAARAGAVIRDPEFVQFHPTALDIGVDPAPLATEALRGDGALLVNEDGRRFMPDYHKRGELGPRDVVARAVEAERAAGRGAFLDARQAIGAKFPTNFPTVFAACGARHIDPRTELMPVAPAAHYHMGGVMTDFDGRSALKASPPSAKSPRPACMAPIASPRTRCSKPSSSARASANGFG